jgi:eukaryotic-like serine/threonine-protein kinase
MVNDTLRAEVQESLHDLFTLGRELPRGGMSRVFVATEIALRRTVVIKVLAPELAATLSAERFKREIGLAARLQHPLIVPLLSAGQAGPHLYYTMPFVDGESLRDRMQRERPMAIADVSRIVQEVAAALAYAHAEGVVHRDIKPENVMFFHGQAVVLDFGIGKALIGATTSETETLRITQAGMSLGTPTYVAPEQAAGDQGLDHRADLYALGVVAYEMLTGHPRFAVATRWRCCRRTRSRRRSRSACDGRRRQRRWRSWSWPCWPSAPRIVPGMARPWCRRCVRRPCRAPLVAGRWCNGSRRCRCGCRGRLRG